MAEDLEKRRARNRKYNYKTYETFTFNLKKGNIAELKEYATPRYGSANSFIRYAIAEQVKRDRLIEKETGKMVHYDGISTLPDHIIPLDEDAAEQPIAEPTL